MYCRQYRVTGNVKHDVIVFLDIICRRKFVPQNLGNANYGKFEMLITKSGQPEISGLRNLEIIF